ncbi:MAG: HPr-rel-A system PqqD family peptide chaperone [Motiliproteus sp.]|nr:HPr-rel-A system PqqD family peptide chaperone [Motiliproteus sp.]MCW9053308.1 HPr-rel-A system PqqD family peptide chaperone [Motiliproteus sp.]
MNNKNSVYRSERLIFQHLGNGLIIYHQDSGDTYCLKGLEREIFQALLKSPHTVSELISATAQALPENSGLNLRDLVSKSLDKLTEIHLIDWQ